MTTNQLSDEEFQFFLKNLALYQSNVDEGKILRAKNENSCVGLLNAGSTCYLNAVLQCLFHSTDFLNAVMAGNTTNLIVTELRRLFRFLAHTSRSAVSTTDLLNAFGWSKGQAHEQHDAHELFSLLMDNIEKSSPEAAALLLEAFQAEESEVLQCPKCNAEKGTDSPFRSLAVDIPDNLESGGSAANDTYSLPDLLRDMVKAETLDDDNKWTCASCGESVCATKRRGFKTLAPSLVFQLKRFRFDPMSKKRRKVSSAVEIPNVMTPQSYLDADGDDSYSLTGVVVHLGTAMGGHYKAYVRSSINTEVWWECNDEHVHALTKEEADQLFGSSEDSPSGPKQSLMENAYLLFYSKSTNSCNAVEISEEVQNDNASFDTLVKLENIRRKIVQAEVVVQKITDLSHSAAATMYFPKDIGMGQLSEKVYEHFTANGIVDPSVYPLMNCRIRKFSRSGMGKGETFAGKERSSLNDLGFGDKELLCFEIRLPDDPIFVEFNPHDMILYFKPWTDISAFSDDSAIEANQWTEIVVPGCDQATVGALRTTVATAIGSPQEMLLLVTYDKSIPLALLDDDQAELRKKYKVSQGNRIVVEVKADACSESVALHELKSLRSRIRLQFNNPHSGNLNSYDNDLQTRLDATLSEVKQVIADKLGMAIDSFHLRRNENSPQFKDENKTLDELSISDQSILHVEMGKGCSPGEHMLRFELDITSSDSDSSKKDSGKFILIDEIAISEKSSILNIKKLLHSQWAILGEKIEKRMQSMGNMTSIVAPPTPHHIRLRDLKGGKLSGPLRDDRVACRCLLGMSDGRRIAVQVLPNEEIIGADDLLISVRTLSYDRKVISDPQDLSIPRTFNVKSLIEKLNQVFSSLAEPLDSFEGETESSLIEIAKGYTTGPALSLKSGLKLKWNDPAVIKDGLEALVDRPPLNLRDGSIIAVRGRADWLRAQARVKAKREAADQDSEVAVGGGASAVRARTKGTLASSSEPVLKIGMPPHPDGAAVENSNNSLPQPSPSKA